MALDWQSQCCVVARLIILAWSSVDLRSISTYSLAVDIRLRLMIIYLFYAWISAIKEQTAHQVINIAMYYYVSCMHDIHCNEAVSRYCYVTKTPAFQHKTI